MYRRFYARVLLVVRPRLPDRAHQTWPGSQSSSVSTAGAKPGTPRGSCATNRLPIRRSPGCSPQNRTFDSYLAGGAAILIEPNTMRYSRDLDYFHDSETRVAEAFTADRRAAPRCRRILHRRGSESTRFRARDRDARDNDVTKVEWARDSDWRFMPTVRDDRVGFTLHPVDLAVNKVLALAGRDEPRDVLDTLHLHRRVLALGALCWAACGKDPGFTPLVPPGSAAKTRTGSRRRPRETRPRRAQSTFTTLKRRRGSRRLTRWNHSSHPGRREEIGCLYYSATQQAFVDPRDGVRRRSALRQARRRAASSRPQLTRLGAGVHFFRRASAISSRRSRIRASQPWVVGR